MEKEKYTKKEKTSRKNHAKGECGGRSAQAAEGENAKTGPYIMLSNSGTARRDPLKREVHISNAGKVYVGDFGEKWARQFRGAFTKGKNR